MRKRMVALLFSGVLFSLSVGIGCGKATVEHIATKKTEASEETEKKLEETREEAGEQKAGEKKDTVREEGKEEEKELVKRENKENQETNGAKEEETEKQKALREKLGVPERLLAETTDEQGIVQTIDAAVTVPDADSFMVYSAEKKIFENKDLEMLVEPILGEGGLYRFEPEDYEHLVSRVASVKLQLDYEDYEGEEERQNLEKALETAETCIQELQGTVRKEELVLQMTPEEKLDSGQYFDRLEGFTDWEQRTVQVMVRKYGLIVHSWPLAKKSECTISGEQAEEVAKDYMDRMGLSGEMVLDYAGKQEFDYRSVDKAGHVFAYVRSVEGMPVGYCGSQGLYFVIDDQGIQWIDYRDYVIDENGKQTELLPFSEIQKIYEETPVQIMCEPGELKTVSIDEIRLVYHWVSDSGESVTGHLIPAWEAFGTYQATDGNGVLYTSNPVKRECLLSVSAIDGTILD